jgi:hypothetical protein
VRDRELLVELLAAETEDDVLVALSKRELLQQPARWAYLGGMANNQSIVLAQQSTPAAALVEKLTNSIDAILLRHCKEEGLDPRGPLAPQSMQKATERYFGDLGGDAKQIRVLAEENIVLYATGSKARPSLAIYDAGEGQSAANFPTTFCSLISGSDAGSYKGAIPFVQGRFNMGGTGVLPFCSEKHRLQLVVSRPPKALQGDDDEWAFTLFCFFHSKQNPSWKYLVGADGGVMTAGTSALGLLPKKGAKSGEVVSPRERAADDGTLIKMYDFKATRSNICGEQFKKLQDYLLQPALPIRMIECRDEYKAKVMGVTVWDRLEAWGKDKLEDGFDEGASISIQLSTGEEIPAEVRVFRSTGAEEDNLPQTGLRALINGQSHAKRDASFFRTKAVDKEHISGSMLVTLDCTELGQESRNALFMSNRETFREDPLLLELFKKLQKELHDHEGLTALNLKRYEEKIKNAVSDEEGVSALEDLLANDPALAEMFGGLTAGKVSAKTAEKGDEVGKKVKKLPFEGKEFPTFIRRQDGTTEVQVEVPRGSVRRVSFLTDMQNNYFSRKKCRGVCSFSGDFVPTCHPFDGRLTFTISLPKNVVEGATLATTATITDKVGSGPFVLGITAVVVAENEEPEKSPKKPPVPPHAAEGPSRPNIKEVHKGVLDPPLTIERDPTTKLLQLMLNVNCGALDQAKQSRPAEEEAAVNFVFKYGLALVAMSLLEAAKSTEKWKNDEAACREDIQRATSGIARVIVPICLSLPKSLPKSKV